VGDQGVFWAGETPCRKPFRGKGFRADGGAPERGRGPEQGSSGVTPYYVAYQIKFVKKVLSRFHSALNDLNLWRHLSRFRTVIIKFASYSHQFKHDAAS